MTPRGQTVPLWPLGVDNSLRILSTAERSQVDHCVPKERHSIVPLLKAFTSEPPPLARVFSRLGALDAQASRMEGLASWQTVVL